MTTISRKQREIEKRKQLILDVAGDLLQSGGYLGLSMDKIAEATEYSKGTIYQHFGCKEEVLCALCIRNLNLQSELFQRATHFQGNTREKMLAILTAHQIFVKLYNREFSNLLVIKNISIRDKISTENQNELRASENNCLACLAAVISEAIEKKELTLNADSSIEDIIFGCWSLSFGAALLQRLDIPLAEMGIHDPLKALRIHSAHQLDGHQWQPVSHDWDYEKSYTHICNELFKAEIQQLNKMDNKITL